MAAIERVRDEPELENNHRALAHVNARRWELSAGTGTLDEVFQPGDFDQQSTEPDGRQSFRRTGPVPCRGKNTSKKPLHKKNFLTGNSVGS